MREPGLDGKVVCITGAGSGIGRVLAIAYARAGARVVLAGRRREALDETAAMLAAGGAAALVVPTDVSREPEVEALVEASLDRFGALDVVLNDAGTPGVDTAVEEMTLENWNATIAVNLTGPMLLSREALRRAMLPAGRGNIQLFSSLAAVQVRPRKAHYAVAKLGLVALTETLAREVSGRGVRVNCLMIGLVAGELVDRWVARTAAKGGRDPAQVRRALVADVPIGREVRPEEVADLSLYLASEMASAITGQTIRVSGGR